MLVGDVFLPWDGLRDSLEPFTTKTLQAIETISVLDQVQFESAGIDQGELAIYIGYELISDTDKIYYSVTPLRVAIVLGAVASRSRYVGVDSCSPYAVKRTSAIIYGTGTVTSPATAEFDLLLDLYVPDVDLSGKKVPSMVIIHGGGFYGGTRSQPSLVDYAERFAAQGYLAISIDYRVAPQVPELSPQFASFYDPSVSTAVATEAKQALEQLRDDVIEIIRYMPIWAEAPVGDLRTIPLGVRRKNATQRHGVTRWKRGVNLDAMNIEDVEVIDLHPRLLEAKWRPYGAFVLHHEVFQQNHIVFSCQKENVLITVKQKFVFLWLKGFLRQTL